MILPIVWSAKLLAWGLADMATFWYNPTALLILAALPFIDLEKFQDSHKTQVLSKLYDGRVLPSLLYLRRQVRLTLKGKRVQQGSSSRRRRCYWLANAKRGKAQSSVILGGMAPKRCHAEPKRYRVRELGGQWIDASGWLAL
ncbi:uncharacterized protein F5147DRAFT_647618 [Suillus discolor]|uniref:Uncharacterized protein n=1 Tax=Suillus discolor TaxID=1912936 RepID=A0A9P7FJF5_9AGAM|nr:uncharacterized protein F5147DRAFT_647618 [Suillus discolor]KAG2119726.1 hypothetical protein F5147DRAFT_647618 [Suillus discolor]